MDFDLNFIRHDLRASMGSDEVPSKPFNSQKELEQRAATMRRSVGAPDERGDIFDLALRKLLGEGASSSTIAKSARVAQGHTWPHGYQPTEELLGEPPKLFARIVEREPKLRTFASQFEEFVAEFSV